MNTQPIEKKVSGGEATLDIQEIFLTIQGEGPFAGERAVFVRLAGCNLQCPLCDTDYTSSREHLRLHDISDRIIGLTGLPLNHLVVITGGEPLRQGIGSFCHLLIELGFRVQIETNGTLFQGGIPYSHQKLTVVCSPKAGKINKNLAPHIAALKYVVHADQIDDDGLPIQALAHTAHPVTAKPPESFQGQIYVQPVDVDDFEENQRHLRAAIKSCMTHGYRLCVQLHKIIGME